MKTLLKNPALTELDSPPRTFSLPFWLRRSAVWIADHELFFLPVAGLPLLFPRGNLPWVGSGLFGLLWVCRRVKSGRFTARTGLEAPVLLLLLMAFIGVKISLDSGLSQPRFWSLVLGVLAFYGFANLSQAETRVRFLAGLLAVLTLGVAALSLVGTDWQEARLFAIPELYGRLPALVRGLPGSGAGTVSDLFNPRWVGITMGMLAPVFLALLFFARDRWMRWMAAGVAGAAILLLLFSQSLQGLLGLCAGLFFLLVWRSRWFCLLLPLAIAATVIGIVLIGPTNAAAYLLSTQNPIGIAVVLRMDIWSRGLAMLGDMPYTGIGLNSFPVMQTEFYPGFLLGREPHAHNLFLQTALDLGLPGLFAYVWLIAAWFAALHRHFRRASAVNVSVKDAGTLDANILLLGLAAGVISYLAHGVMDAMMLGSKPGVAFWVLLGLGAALTMDQPAGERPEAEGSLYRSAWKPMGLLSVCLLIFFLVRPGSIFMNMASIQAHRGLLQVRQAGALSSTSGLNDLTRAAAGLDSALQRDSRYTQAYGLVGEIAAWQGDYLKAVQAYLALVSSDWSNPYGQYHPSEYWLRRLTSQDETATRPQDLRRLYQVWSIRYPQRAAYWLCLSLAYQFPSENPRQALAVLRSGREHNSQPAGILVYYQKLLESTLSTIHP